MELKDLVKLAKIASNTKPSATYSFEGENFTAAEINETLRSELNAIVGNYHKYEENPIAFYKKNRYFFIF